MLGYKECINCAFFVDSYRKESGTKCNACIYLSNYENRNKEALHSLTDIEESVIFSDFMVTLDILVLLSK